VLGLGALAVAVLGSGEESWAAPVGGLNDWNRCINTCMSMSHPPGVDPIDFCLDFCEILEPEIIVSGRQAGLFGGTAQGYIFAEEYSPGRNTTAYDFYGVFGVPLPEDLTESSLSPIFTLTQILSDTGGPDQWLLQSKDARLEFGITVSGALARYGAGDPIDGALDYGASFTGDAATTPLFDLGSSWGAGWDVGYLALRYEYSGSVAYYGFIGLDSSFASTGTVLGAQNQAVIAGSQVPEPAALALLAGGAGLLALRRSAARRPHGPGAARERNA
jgi:hypothetical protein